MPRRLLDRCKPDCIGEFRSAARRRYGEALVLAAAGERTGAIYLWGYAAEMTLKSAYFQFDGLAESDIITVPSHLRPAIARGRSLSIAWPPQGDGHNVRAWAELLIKVRDLTPGTSFTPSFRREVHRHGQRIGAMWRETLRYRKNNAYAYEMRQVREATEWFLLNSSDL